jgi:NarL family two-component system response regulator LiaR
MSTRSPLAKPARRILFGNAIFAPIYKAMTQTNISDDSPGVGGPTFGFSTTRLLVVDDHGIVREGLLALFEKEHDLHAVGSASTATEALSLARYLKPDVVIMDLMLPDLNGIEASREILAEAPRTRIIALSGRKNPEQVYGAFRAGVRGYVVKAAALSELILAVKSVRVGDLYVSPSIACLFPGGMPVAPLPKTPYERLSGREREVLRRIVAGSSSIHIAEELSLSRKTVDTYRGRLMLKLGVSNRWELVRMVMENDCDPVR